MFYNLNSNFSSIWHKISKYDLAIHITISSKFFNLIAYKARYFNFVEHLIKMVAITMGNADCQVRIDGELSNAFKAKASLR